MKVVWWLLRLFGFGLLGGLLGMVFTPLVMRIPGLPELVSRIEVLDGLGGAAIPIWCGGIGGVLVNSAANSLFKKMTGEAPPNA